MLQGLEVLQDISLGLPGILFTFPLRIQKLRTNLFPVNKHKFSFSLCFFQVQSLLIKGQEGCYISLSRKAYKTSFVCKALIRWWGRGKAHSPIPQIKLSLWAACRRTATSECSLHFCLNYTIQWFVLLMLFLLKSRILSYKFDPIFSVPY